MKSTQAKRLSIALLLAVLVVNATALWPELSISRVDLNDNIFHFTLVERIVQAVQRGENPLDCWSSEWTLGYPVLRTYQPLAHALVALVYFALGKSVSLMTVFTWARFLSLALLPLSFFAAARLMQLSWLTSAATAMLAPMVSTNFLYGIEYNSFTWAGSGLFPQAVATHFLLLTVGLAFRSIRRGRHLALTGGLLGLTFLAHLIYGYIGAITIVLLAVIPDAEVARAIRLRRLVWVGAVSAMLAAFQLVPLLLDGVTVNHSRWEPVWKWDSFGFISVAQKLFTGELLDFGRLPVLTALSFFGAGLYFWNVRKRRPNEQVHQFILFGAGFWILMFFGRPFWGPLLVLLGVSADMQLHRVIGGVHIFLILLAAIGLKAFWEYASLRWQWFGALAASALIFFPMVQERQRTLQNDAKWGNANLAANGMAQQAIDATVSRVKERPGRAYAGLAAGWGATFKIGDVPFYANLSKANIPAVSFLYHSMALTSDLMVRFNEQNPDHYRLFAIQTVIAPAAMSSLPGFLTPKEQIGRFRIFDTPGAGYFDVVDVPFSVKATHNDFYDINDRWLQSDWVGKRTHILLDWRDDAPAATVRISPDDALPFAPTVLPLPGAVVSEQRNGEVYQASLQVERPSYALFKMTWHQNWKAYVDGAPVKTVMLSPGFTGAPVSQGRHNIVFRYEPESWKAALAIGGFAVVLLLIAGEGRGYLPGYLNRQRRLPSVRWGSAPAIACGLVLLALPVCIPLFTSSVIYGHDAFCYFPRAVEVHQNVANGIVIPRWAPDLDRGAGQPLFFFHPPMFSWLAEFCHLLGADYVTAVNLACVLIVLGSALGMFLLGRLYFGDMGGWLAAAAYIYAPYFAVDLYVRSALEEFTVFPLIAFALYGFAAYARHGKRVHWLLGAAAYAAILVSHFPASLLFTPLLLAFFAFTAWTAKSWPLFANQLGGWALGLALGACGWLPALTERQYVALSRVLEGPLRYTNHFLSLHQLFYSPWGYGLSVPGPNDGMSFELGWSQLMLAGLVWFWAVRYPDLDKNAPAHRNWLRFFTAALVVLCVFALEDSIWFWDHAPLLQSVLYPWRMLGPAAVCTALLTAPLAWILGSLDKAKPYAFAGAMAFLIVPNLSHMHPRELHDVDLAFWTPRQMAERGFETTTLGEVNPRWMINVPPYTEAPAQVTAGDARIETAGRTPFHWWGRASATGASSVQMSTAYFPGWEARVDGQAVPMSPSANYGLISFAVPSGSHDLDVAWRRTPAVTLADGLSLAALLVCIGILVKQRGAVGVRQAPALLVSRDAAASLKRALFAGKLISPAPRSPTPIPSRG